MVMVEKTADGCLLKVTIVPRAARNEIIGLYGETLKIKIKSPPADNKANAELIDFLARTLAIAKNKVTILRGLTGRKKIVKCIGNDVWNYFKKTF
jgi:hypothetical protein